MIGRKKEIQLFQDLIKKDESSFVAIYGRRRVGKTYLVRESFNNRFTFSHAGLADANKSEQLQAFGVSLVEAGMELKSEPKNWIEAFALLRELVKSSNEQKKVIFIDELSWMDTRGSNLISALENFWNGWASGRKDVVLIVCASATSWMLNKVIHNKGGLYNRLTAQIHLQQFTLGECREYLVAQNVAMNNYQILQLYMILGGVPYYWSLIKKGLGVPKNVDSLFFCENAPLADEFRYLYAAIFKNPTDYIKIIETLASKNSGMSREEIAQMSGLPNSGNLTDKLDELISSGFVRRYYFYGKKKKDATYQLVDLFTIFYFRFLTSKSGDENFWSNQINTPTVNAWEGVAFEMVCLLHVNQIKKKLGISGVLTECYSFHCKANPDKGLFGSQVDLLIERRDQVINLCEMKFSESEYNISEKFVMDLRKKISDFRNYTGTKYAIYSTLVSTYGVVDNSYSYEIQSIVKAEDLFE